jgi:hypothetical protein
VSPEEIRRQLATAGFVPVPCLGKKPIVDDWQKLADVSPAEIAWWSRTAPAAENTGILTRSAPAVDIDIFDPDAAAAVEAHIREHFEEKGIIRRAARFWPGPARTRSIAIISPRRC